MLGFARDLLCESTDDARARIDDPILAMAHAHDAAAGGEALRDEVLRVGGAADFHAPSRAPADRRRRADGPNSAPMAADSAEPTGASVDVTTRAVNVLALKL